MEDVDFEDEEPDGPAWETEEENDDEEEGGGTDGMEAQDDSEVTFTLHSGERGLPGSCRPPPGFP